MILFSQYTARQITVLAICVAIFALGQFHRASGGVYTPILMDRFAVSTTVIGGLVSAMFFATIIAQVPFGAALDRYGPRPVLSFCILVIAAGTVLFAGAVAFETLFLARCLIGVGLAAMGAATHVIIARNFAAADFGYVSGLVVTLGGIGGLLGTYPLAFALSRAPWGVVFGVVACATILLAWVVFRTVEPRAAKVEETEAQDASEGILSLLSKPEFLRILVLAAVTYAPITTITGLWGGPFLQDVAGLSAQQAGAVLLALFSATIVAGYIFGVLDRSARSRKGVILTALALSALMLLALAILPAPHPLLAIALLLGMVFAQQFYIPLGAHMRRTVPDHMLGRASTVFSLVAVAAIPAMQLGFGAILDTAAATGFAVQDQYRIAFGVMAVAILSCGGVYSFSKDVDETITRP